MMVRDQISKTKHRIYGRLERGFIRSIKPEHFNSLIFERIPESPADIGVGPRCPKTGKTRSIEMQGKIRVKLFKAWKRKYQKQYDEENKLAIERIKGGK